MMKNLFISLLLITFVACGTNNKEEDSTDPEMENFVAPQDRLAWNVEYDNVSGESFLRLKSDTLHPSAATVIEAANILYPEVKIQLEKQSNDTIYVSIPESEHLTQRMGSAGAQEYLVFMTYNLLAVPGAQQVYFSFNGGDHASPGVYNKESFKDFPKK